jgi:RNA polymerase sigma-70 factor (ECF subfamily)
MAVLSKQFTCVNHVPLPVKDRTGQTYCYNCVIETHQSQAYNLARRLLSDWSLAEDAVQESFVSGYRAFAQFRGQNLKAWLMRIVANSCRDMLRSQRARPTVPLDPTPTDSDDPTSSAVDLPSDQPSPEDLTVRNELRRTIESALASLSPDRRLAIVLVDVQGFSYEEAAQVMNCSLGTVKSRISRARGELREYLRRAGELLPAQFRRDN